MLDDFRWYNDVFINDENWWKGVEHVLELIHSRNVRVRLPKDQPRAFEENPCILGSKDCPRMGAHTKTQTLNNKQ